MSLLIKNGEIVTAAERYKADIWCEGETITSIGPNLPAPPGAEVIDAAGKLVFPGFHRSARPHLSALHGHVCQGHVRNGQPGGAGRRHDNADRNGLPARGDDPLEAYELWKSKAAGQSACDYAFHMGVTRFDERTPDQLAKNRRRRHRVVQSFFGLQGGVWRRRHRTVSHAGIGQALGRHRHRALRKCRTGFATAATACWPKAKRARSGTNRRGRRWSKPKACIIWRRLPD